MQLGVRKLVREGDPIPIRLGLGPDGSSGLHAFVRATSLRIDDREIDTRDAELESDWGERKMDLLAPSMPPGRHVLIWNTDVLCYDTSDGANSLYLATTEPAADPRAHHRFQRRHVAEFEVTPLTAPDPIQLVESPEAAAYLAALSKCTRDVADWGINHWFEVAYFLEDSANLEESPKLPRPPELGLSMQVTARSPDGQSLGWTVVSQSPDYRWQILDSHGRRPAKEQQFTIHMSTTRDAAARTLDLYRIWNGTATALNVRLEGPGWICGGVRGGPLFQRSETEVQRAAYLKAAQDRWSR